jgi:hypothetical protein
MTLSVDCSVVTSIRVVLTYGVGPKKDVILEVGDLVDIEYNKNGLRKDITGRIIKISATGTDPNGWWIVVDGSDDFESTQARFSPMNIIDVDIIKKGDSEHTVSSPIDSSGVECIRVVNGYLQYTKNGYTWYDIKTGRREDEIHQENGTVPTRPHHHSPCNSDEDLSIEDEIND